MDLKLVGAKTYGTLKRIYHAGRKETVTEEEWSALQADMASGSAPLFVEWAEAPAAVEESPVVSEEAATPEESPDLTKEDVSPTKVKAKTKTLHIGKKGPPPATPLEDEGVPV